MYFQLPCLRPPAGYASTLRQPLAAAPVPSRLSMTVGSSSSYSSFFSAASASCGPSLLSAAVSAEVAGRRFLASTCISTPSESMRTLKKECFVPTTRPLASLYLPSLRRMTSSPMAKAGSSPVAGSEAAATARGFFAGSASCETPSLSTTFRSRFGRSGATASCVGTFDSRVWAFLALCSVKQSAASSGEGNLPSITVFPRILSSAVHSVLPLICLTPW